MTNRLRGPNSASLLDQLPTAASHTHLSAHIFDFKQGPHTYYVCATGLCISTRLTLEEIPSSRMIYDY
jgi:hypothetical protein